MAHASGNPAWQDLPSTATPITAATLEQLETAVDGAVAYPKPWQPLPLLNGWANRDSAVFYPASYRFARPDRVELTGTIVRGTGAPNAEHIALLPAEARPVRENHVPLIDSAGYVLGLAVKATGNISIYSFRTTATTISLVGSFLVTGPT